MARRCTFCGAWTDANATTCEECGERLALEGQGWRRVARPLLLLAGALLIGNTVTAVVEPVFEPRVAFNVRATLLFFAGVFAVLAGLSRR